jgi:hypothetical protein
MSLFYRYLIFFFFLATTVAQAQEKKPDVIVTFDNQKLEVIIVEVSKESVKYKKLNNPDGPLFVVEKSTIASILYSTGEVETFAKPADLYFEQKKIDNNEIPYTVDPPKAGSAAERKMQAQSSKQLKSNYELYTRKASTYRKMGIIGSSVGVLFVGIGSIMISEANKSSNFYSSNYDERITGGVMLIMTGLGGGIPLTIVGLTKNRSYTKRALKVQEELRRRNEPLNSLRIRPSIDPLGRSGQVTLSMSF